VQHGQQQLYSVQDPAALTYVDPSQVLAFVNYLSNLDYDPGNAAEYGGYPVQYTHGTDLPAAHATCGSNSVQSYNHVAPVIYIPESSSGALTMLITFRWFLNNTQSRNLRKLR
jgi:hypothetical protein